MTRCDQLAKPFKTVFHEPKRSRRLRHGTPVFALYRTASMNVLSSSLGAGPRRLGTAMLTIAHCASVKAWRKIRPALIMRRAAEQVLCLRHGPSDRNDLRKLVLLGV